MFRMISYTMISSNRYENILSHTRNAKMAEEAWTDLFSRLEHTPAPPFRIETVLPPEVPAPLDECTSISTNDAALWSLDAIYMQEVIPVDG